MNSATINLREDSQVYEQFSYPAGEHQIRFRGRFAADEVSIIARISNGDSIMKLALLKNALSHVPSVRLVLPYLPYSRADRRFSDGDCYGLQSFGSLLNAMEFDSITTIDAHNAVAAAQCIAKLKDASPSEFIDRSIVEFAHKHKSSHITVLFPDEGARLRYKVPKGIETNTDAVGITVAHCRKKRNALTGKMEGFEVPSITSRNPAIIIDDICDGGATFIGIAQQCVGVNLGLYVTHGIFSKGYTTLLSHFDHIYTTNTIKHIPELDRVTVMDATPVLMAKK